MILKLEEEMLNLRDQLIAANMDSEKTSVAALSKALEDRDRQINELKQRMELMVGEMESDAALMEDCRNEMTRGEKPPYLPLNCRILLSVIYLPI